MSRSSVSYAANYLMHSLIGTPPLHYSTRRWEVVFEMNPINKAAAPLRVCFWRTVLGSTRPAGRSKEAEPRHSFSYASTDNLLWSEVLCQGGANVDFKSVQGYYPLMFARKHPAIVRVLLRFGADITLTQSLIGSRRGMTAEEGALMQANTSSSRSGHLYRESAQ